MDKPSIAHCFQRFVSLISRKRKKVQVEGTQRTFIKHPRQDDGRTKSRAEYRLSKVEGQSGADG